MYWCPKQNSPKGRSERENHFFHFKPLCPLSAHRFLSWFREVKMESEDSFSDLIKMAKKLESDILAKINFSSAHVIDLDRLLCDTFIRQCPTPLDYDNRRDLVHIFNTMTKEIYGNGDGSPVVEEYGSFVMDMFDGKSDIDLSLNFNNSIEVSRQKKISALYRFNKKLQSIQSKGHVTGLQLIFSARVPIIKVTDSGTGIECDLSVDNRDGINKSHIIRAISDIDERFRKLCFLMKSWAKVHDINSPKDSTLSSFSIVSFVAFHLQTRNPPILPPFSILLKEGDNPAYVAKVVETYFNYGKQNKESLAMLFITLLVKLASVENLWQKGFCASLYEGSWILKSWKCSYSMSGLGNLDSQWKPVVCPAFRDRTLKAIACGGAHTLFLTDNGCVYATGLNDFGQLGVSESKHYSVEPLCVFGEEKKVVQVSAGYNHSCAITVDGELYMWGKNTSVQLGLGKRAPNIVPLPTKVEYLNGINIKMAALGSDHSLAISDGGEAFSWGVGVSGRLGHGHESSILGFFKSYSEYTPRLIKDLEGIKV
ncbi:Putative E3 ubiquitin-protein ligase HERC4 [Glycine soja]|nr:Putative E3 ubiquitin-protein ligase HERC4 [Glycine soja]